MRSHLGTKIFGLGKRHWPTVVHVAGAVKQGPAWLAFAAQKPETKDWIKYWLGRHLCLKKHRGNIIQISEYHSDFYEIANSSNIIKILYGEIKFVHPWNIKGEKYIELTDWVRVILGSGWKRFQSSKKRGSKHLSRKMGCRHSSADLSLPSILPPWVRVPSTP